MVSGGGHLAIWAVAKFCISRICMISLSACCVAARDSLLHRSSARVIVPRHSSLQLILMRVDDPAETTERGQNAYERRVSSR